MTKGNESDESEDEEDYGNPKSSSMSKNTIGIIGGILTMFSAFAFYKASR